MSPLERKILVPRTGLQKVMVICERWAGEFCIMFTRHLLPTVLRMASRCRCLALQLIKCAGRKQPPRNGSAICSMGARRTTQCTYSSTTDPSLKSPGFHVGLASSPSATLQREAAERKASFIVNVCGACVGCVQRVLLVDLCAPEIATEWKNAVRSNLRPEANPYLCRL